MIILGRLRFSLLFLAECGLSVVYLAYREAPLWSSFVTLCVLLIRSRCTRLHCQIQIRNRARRWLASSPALSLLLSLPNQICFEPLLLAVSIAFVQRFQLNELLEHVWQYADALLELACFCDLLDPKVNVVLLSASDIS